MKDRYEEASQEAIDLFDRIQAQHFPELRNAAIKVLFDTKKSTHGGKIQLACIKRPNDLLRYFTALEKEAYEGYDYIIILDKICWTSCGETDHERIMRHELRHTSFDIESEDDPYKLVEHEIEDFYAEVEFNREDPRWAQRLSQLTSDIYEQMKENGAQGKGKKEKKLKIHKGQGRLEEDECMSTITIKDGDGKVLAENVTVEDLKRAAEILRNQGAVAFHCPECDNGVYETAEDDPDAGRFFAGCRASFCQCSVCHTSAHQLTHWKAYEEPKGEKCVDVRKGEATA